MSAQTIHKSQKVSKADVVFNIILYGICGLILLLIAYPLYFIIIASFSNPSEVSNGNVWFWPSQFTLDGYKELLRHGSIWMGYWNTILYTVVGNSHRPDCQHLCSILSVSQRSGRTQVNHVLFHIHDVL